VRKLSAEKLKCNDGVLTAATVPEIAQGLKKITCAQGKAARFEAVIHGQPPPQITWCDLLNLIFLTLYFFHFCSHFRSGPLMFLRSKTDSSENGMLLFL